MKYKYICKYKLLISLHKLKNSKNNFLKYFINGNINVQLLKEQFTFAIVP